MLRNDENARHKPNVQAHDIEYTVLAASDAMNSRAAGISISPQATETDFITYDFDASETSRHINWKETIIAILTLRWLLPLIEEFSVIRIGVNNTTAWVALDKLVFTCDETLQIELDDLAEAFDKKKCQWTTVQVPGIDQPSDARSRGLVTDPRILKVCVERLMANESCSQKN